MATRVRNKLEMYFRNYRAYTVKAVKCIRHGLVLASEQLICASDFVTCKRKQIFLWPGSFDVSAFGYFVRNWAHVRFIIRVKSF